ncbi:MAG: type II secretion system GspH family protein [Agarilytica sp.]
MGLKRFSGVTLIETIIFLVVVSIAVGILAKVYAYSVVNSVDPVIRARALELAQAQLDEILARKFDESTPTGGVPACDTLSGPLCSGIVADPDYDDIGDYHDFVNNDDPNHTLTVSVTEAGGDLGIPASQARRISVSATLPGGDDLVLSVYKTNF